MFATLLALATTAQAGWFTFENDSELYVISQGPTTYDEWIVDWYNMAGVPTSPAQSLVKIGNFRGTQAELESLVGVILYPDEYDEEQSENGIHLIFGQIENVPGQWPPKRRSVFVMIDSTMDLYWPEVPWPGAPYFHTYVQAVFCSATWPSWDPAEEHEWTDCDRTSLPAIQVNINPDAGCYTNPC